MKKFIWSLVVAVVLWYHVYIVSEPYELTEDEQFEIDRLGGN